MPGPFDASEVYRPNMSLCCVVAWRRAAIDRGVVLFSPRYSCAGVVGVRERSSSRGTIGVVLASRHRRPVLENSPLRGVFVKAKANRKHAPWDVAVVPES